MCYGGLFGATKKTIHRTSRTSWEQMRDSLTRGDNIEEGHYAERSWLGLLSQPLTESNERKLQGAATGTCGLGPSAGSCLAGQLRTCDCAQLAKREADTVSLDVPLPPSTGGIATCDTCGSCWCKF